MKRRTRRALGGIALGIGILAGAFRAPLMAHHSFADYYIEADTIEIDGDVVEFQYRNPHAWIFVQANEAGFGQAKIYAAEWVSTSQLDRAGIDKKFFKPGDTLHIWASPNKNPSDNRVRLKRMERRSDGWKWTGNRGDTR
jgi:hypothetical protein